MTTTNLQALQRAAYEAEEAARQASSEYRAAIQREASSGTALAKIASELGISRQRVWQIIKAN